MSTEAKTVRQREIEADVISACPGCGSKCVNRLCREEREGEALRVTGRFWIHDPDGTGAWTHTIRYCPHCGLRFGEKQS